MLSGEDVYWDRNRKRVFGYPVLTIAEIAEIYASVNGSFRLQDHCLDCEEHTVEIVTMRLDGLPVINEMEARRLEDAVETLAKFIQPAKKVPRHPDGQTGKE